MGEIFNSAVDAFFGLLGDLVMQFASFVLGFFPDADATLLDSIHEFGASMRGGWLTFNVFYFIDMETLAVWMAFVVTMVTVAFVYAFVKWLIRVIHDILDAIPVIG